MTQGLRHGAGQFGQDRGECLGDALQHRAALHTMNPHLIVTRGTKADGRPASSAYLSHILDPVGLSPHRLLVTRLAELVNTTDPKTGSQRLRDATRRRHRLPRRSRAAGRRGRGADLPCRPR